MSCLYNISYKVPSVKLFLHTHMAQQEPLLVSTFVSLLLYHPLQCHGGGLCDWNTAKITNPTFCTMTLLYRTPSWHVKVDNEANRHI